MIGLVPRDYWEHSFGEYVRCLAGAVAPLERNSVLYIAGLGNCIPVRSGRAGLMMAIKALNLRPGSRIGVPLYCCPVVFQAITAAGCTVRFIDIDPESFCMSPEDVSGKRKHLDAIVAVHMFGNTCDMAGLMDAAQGMPVIEDCAQALGSRIVGRTAGTYGSVSFFSFRSGKYISAGEGGALFSVDAQLRANIFHLTDQMNTTNYAGECMHASKTYLKALLRDRPLYGIAGYPLWRFFTARRRQVDQTGVEVGQIYRTDLGIVRKRLIVLDAAIERQRENAAYYSRTLEVEHGMLCWERDGMYYNRYLYPVTFPSTESRDRMADYLLKRGIDTMKYLDDVVGIAARNNGYSGDCPISEDLSRRVLIIPSYHGLEERHVRRIAQCVNEGWAAIRNART